MSWTAGYVSEIDYTHGYYRELNPALLRFACLSAGVVPPEAHRIRYLELGFGQGLSINIHAAATDGEFHGVDFNPTQTANARSLAGASGAKATLLDDSFQQFLRRGDGGEFDYIGVHGIWSWISDENRKAIVDIVSRHLKVGGVLYISYNCLPGWAPALPLRHLMTLHSEFAGAEAAGVLGKIEGSLKFAQQVVDTGALYFRANPAVAERLKQITKQNRHYLAHEYFNLDWDVMPFSAVAARLEEAKVSFVASAHLLDHVDVANLTAPAQKLLAEIQHPVLRQSVRDYFVNQQFRRDIFIKGPRKLSGVEFAEALNSTSFILMNDPGDVPMKVGGVLGEVTLQEAVYKPVIEVLAENGFASKKVGDLTAHPKLKGTSFLQLSQVLLVLAGAGHIHPTQQPSKDTRAHCLALNRSICDRARGRAEIECLASPIIGGGVPVIRIQQLFLLGHYAGKKAIPEQVQLAWQVISSQGGRMVKDGKDLQSEEDNVAELTRQALAFHEKRMPILKALGVLG